ncbi:MAG: SagB/ThcOx family dehydrogenase [Bacteroidota bacterium]
MKQSSLVMLTVALLVAVSLNAQELPGGILPPVSFDRSVSLMSAIQLRKSTRDFSTKELSPQDLSNLLWCADGINRPATGNRTVPSAMNRRSIDVYVILKSGIYCYIPEHHGLRTIKTGDYRRLAGTQAFVANAPLNLLYVADLNRLDFTKDEGDKLSLASVEAGHCSENVYLYAATAQMGAVVRAYVDRTALNKLLKLTPAQRIIVAQTVGYPLQKE